MRLDTICSACSRLLTFYPTGSLDGLLSMGWDTESDTDWQAYFYRQACAAEYPGFLLPRLFEPEQGFGAWLRARTLICSPRRAPHSFPFLAEINGSPAYQRPRLTLPPHALRLKSVFYQVPRNRGQGEEQSQQRPQQLVLLRQAIFEPHQRDLQRLTGLPSAGAGAAKKIKRYGSETWRAR